MDNGAATKHAAGARTPAAGAGTPTVPAGGVVGPSSRGLMVVGPGAAFGTALLHRFAAEGFRLGVISRSAETVARVTGELAAADHPVAGAVADVTDQAAFTAAAGRVAAEIGGLTVLVYNAKLSIRGTAFSVRAESMNQTLAVNVPGQD